MDIRILNDLFDCITGVVSCVGYYCGTTTNCLNDTTKICDGYNDCGAYEEEKGCMKTIHLIF